MTDEATKIGICLSGGGAKCIAHIGVLQALNDLGIFPNVFSGSSAGALVGVLYSSGLSPKEILDLVVNSEFRKLFKFSTFNTKLRELGFLDDLLAENVKARTIEELNFPVAIGASNISKGRFEVFQSGDLASALKASCAIPIVFSPVLIGEDHYVDGGLLNNLPVEPLLETCHKTIGVSVCVHQYDEDISGILATATRIFQLAIWNTMEARMPKFDFFLEVDGMEDVGLFDVKLAQDSYQKGWGSVMKRRGELEAMF